VDQIEEAVIEHGLNPGDKLPTSRELQGLVGTSQGTLREALRILQQKGLIEARPGRTGGLYVKAVSSDQMSESLGLLIRQKQISLKHLFVFRSTLEVSAASLAAIKAENEDIEPLKKLIAEAEKYLTEGLRSWRKFYEVEDRMHRALARMTKNPLFESVLITVYQNCPEYNSQLVPPKTENMRDSFQDWCQILESLERKKPEKASGVMTKHIQRFLPTKNHASQRESESGELTVMCTSLKVAK
jgi:GntR family transcriptional repressor for pyruvate dehydrogenase complex